MKDDNPLKLTNNSDIAAAEIRSPSLRSCQWGAKRTGRGPVTRNPRPAPMPATEDICRPTQARFFGARRATNPPAPPPDSSGLPAPPHPVINTPALTGALITNPNGEQP